MLTKKVIASVLPNWLSLAVWYGDDLAKIKAIVTGNPEQPLTEDEMISIIQLAWKSNPSDSTFQELRHCLSAEFSVRVCQILDALANQTLLTSNLVATVWKHRNNTEALDNFSFVFESTTSPCCQIEELNCYANNSSYPLPGNIPSPDFFSWIRRSIEPLVASGRSQRLAVLYSAVRTYDHMPIRNGQAPQIIGTTLFLLSCAVHPGDLPTPVHNLIKNCFTNSLVDLCQFFADRHVMLNHSQLLQLVKLYVTDCQRLLDIGKQSVAKNIDLNDTVSLLLEKPEYIAGWKALIETGYADGLLKDYKKNGTIDIQQAKTLHQTKISAYLFEKCNVGGNPTSFFQRCPDDINRIVLAYVFPELAETTSSAPSLNSSTFKS